MRPMKLYRVVTRPDFDGVVCAVLLGAALRTTERPLWIEPYEFAGRAAELGGGDVVANLPFSGRAAYWFDHHETNDPGSREFDGAFRPAPSAARVIYEHFMSIPAAFSELVDAADKIDSADFTEEEILYPERNPYQLISLTIDGKKKEDEGYWNWLVAGLRTRGAEELVDESELRERSKRILKLNESYKEYLLRYTRTRDNVSITDFRPLAEPPSGFRFTVFPLFPETNVNVKIRRKRDDPGYTIISMGHSVTNRSCTVNLARLASAHGGGGHAGAAAFSVRREDEEAALAEVIGKLTRRGISR